MSDRISAWAAKWRISPEALKELYDLDALEPDAEVRGEAAVVRECRLTADGHNAVLWRNNSGATFDQTGRMIRYGLGNDSAKLSRDYKSSDLVGIGPGGVFMAVECKAPGWKGPKNDRDRAQANFMNHVRAMGGRATFATSGAHVVSAIMGRPWI